jgi:hypothetical protein
MWMPLPAVPTREYDTAAFFVTLNTVNFGSGYFPHLRKRPGMSGFYTVASSLTDHFHCRGPLSAEQLAAITVDDCLSMFDQARENGPARELMGLFAQAFADLGRYLLDRFHGRFTELIEAADRSALRLIAVLAEMPFFRDVALHSDLSVPFYKRAQITAADLALAFDGRGLVQFADLDQLTIFADNLVPHVLRMDRVLVYDDGLAERIDREELIPAGSPEEVDYLLWHRGQEPYYKKTKPRHRARTVYY